MIVRALPFLILLPQCIRAQLITASLVGRIVDPSGLAAQGANLELTRADTGRIRRSVSTETGDFAFNGIEQGRFTLSITLAGFRKIERSDITVDTGQRLDLGVVTLEVGALSDTVTVSGERGAVVATQSSERADLISSRQVEGLLNLGRNITALVQLAPGVVLTRDSDALSRTTDFNVNGSRRTMNNVSIDGLPSTDVGNAFSLKLNVSQDAVAEAKVLLSNYQAEYGRQAGSNVHIVTKSGTREFHGLVSYYKRHEQFNANNFFNNQRGVVKPRYRFNAWTYNIGGPVYIPGKWNREKNKLFFFWGQESWPTRRGIAGTVTTPTDLERSGDFSRSVDLNNQLIAVRDPLTLQPFPANRVPASRLDPSGVALLKIFPEPNFFDRSISRGNYNYAFTTETSSPHSTDTLKLDYSFNERNLLVFGYNGYYEKDEGSLGFATAASNWPQWNYAFLGDTQGITTRYTRVFSPSTLNELHFGFLHHPERNGYNDETVARNQRKTHGFTAGQFFPGNNPLGLIPDATFAGVPNAATLAKDGRFPFTALNNILNWDNKITWNKSTHTVKAGAYVEWFQRDIGQPVVFAGSFDFGRNANNPIDTGYAYSNAALGVFNAYSEASAKPYPEARNMLVEFFIQDNWRATKRLTLDYGIRLYSTPPIYEINDKLAGFVASRYDRSTAPALIRPGLDSAGRRVGVHPVTGQIYSATLIGAIAPGIGDPANGMVLASDSNYPRALTENPRVLLGPRFGFAYDLFGDSKTALRGGFGIFYNRPNFGTWLLPYSAQPPLNSTPVVNFGTISNLLSSSGLVFPINVLGADRNSTRPRVMNFSFSIQRNVGSGTVVDAGYVGSLGRHLLWRRPLNAIPFGTNFDSRNNDPTTGRVLQPQFLRPVIGYNNIDIAETASSSNYHALQVSVSRRFQRGLQFGAAWTWSKSLDFNDEDANTVSSLISPRVWNYGLASFDRTHNLKINWLWNIPNARSVNTVFRQVVNGWQISGIATFASGAPLGVDFQTTTPIDITGSPTDLPRIVVTGNPVLPKSERTFERNFRTDVFRVPPVGAFGNAAKTLIRGPGDNNLDVAIFKNFPIYERLNLQFRCELYNAFNHTQFAALNTTARFDPQGAQVNTAFGQFTSASDARIMQLALRLYF